MLYTIHSIFFKTKFDEMRVNVYNTTLDILINGLNLELKFRQETLDMINMIGNFVNLDITYRILPIK